MNGRLLCKNAIGLQYKIAETDHRFNIEWWGGYTRHNKIWQQIYSTDHKLISEHLIAQNNAIMMYNPILENKD